MPSLLLTDLHAATMTAASGYGLIEDAAIVIVDGTISAVGPRGEVVAPPDATTVSLGGRLVTPGLIDCHTHLLFGGNRSDEFAARLSGSSYEQIAAAGGGIRSTVRATRNAADDTLFDAALVRLNRLHKSGATTVEIKSGYGLDLDTELRMLRIARRLAAAQPVEIVTTLLAAHVVPEEYANNPDGYVSVVTDEILPAAAEAHLADAVDVFCESLAFSPEQTEQIFAAAARHGLPVKAHVAQLTANRGVEVAAAHAALSADHLEYASDTQVAALAEAGTVAVLLPGATHTLQEEQRPPIAALRRHGVPIALATDLNPGTSPVADLLAVCNLGALLYGMTPDECLAGVTRNAAAALGLHDRGQLAADMRADLAVWDVADPVELSYWLGMDLCSAVWVAGVLSFDRGDG